MGFFSNGLFPILFSVIFGVVVVIIAAQVIRGIAQWHRNNQSPQLTVPARVMSKRTSVSHHQTPMAGDATGAHGYMTTSSSTCCVTFQLSDGERMELHVPESEFGMLVEGDAGQLSYQGTRYLSFERTVL